MFPIPICINDNIEAAVHGCSAGQLAKFTRKHLPWSTEYLRATAFGNIGLWVTGDCIGEVMSPLLSRLSI